MEFVIITGLSGAGKSQAVNMLEDINYYCMDNLPPILLPNFIDLCKRAETKIEKVAVVIDIRSGEFFNDFRTSLDLLSEMGSKYSILFLDANDDELIKRYKELRRPHPLSTTGTIQDGIKKEREMLNDVKRISSHVINTTEFKLDRLKEEILNIYVGGISKKNMAVNILSFGYKHGIPIESDLVFDVRFLPNPYYVKELKKMTGNDKDVSDYVMSFDVSKEAFSRLKEMLLYLLEQYEEEGRSNLVISIGCTGGHHRSVTFANKLYEVFSSMDYMASVRHRDMDK